MTLSRRYHRAQIQYVKRLRRIAAVALSAAVIVGCQYPTPYVFTEREFDRSSADFNKELPNRDSVAICMSPFADPSESVVALAEAECQKYGKSVRFVERRFGKCPLLIASAATFQCVAPAPSTH